MLLSNKYNFLFVHIAKTGGTSVRTALNKLRWRDPYYPMMFLCHRFSHLTGHKLGTKFPRHSKIIAAREMLPAEHFNQLFKFTFVRNPWDLQVSSFHHIRRERPQVMNGIDNFNEFMRWKFNPERPYQYHIDTSLQLQSDYLVDLHGNKLVDFIGRTENLQEDFDKACDTIGIKPMRLPQKRVAKDRGKDYRAYYADDTAALVAQYFARDIEMFAYDFEQS